MTRSAYRIASPLDRMPDSFPGCLHSVSRRTDDWTARKKHTRQYQHCNTQAFSFHESISHCERIRIHIAAILLATWCA